jgi:hypothetical protein
MGQKAMTNFAGNNVLLPLVRADDQVDNSDFFGSHMTVPTRVPAFLSRTGGLSIPLDPSCMPENNSGFL